MPAAAMFGEEDALIERVAWVPGKAKTKRRPNSRPEDAVQMAIIQRLAFHGIVCAAVRNEGKRSTIGGHMAKKSGLIGGFPDLVVMQPMGRIAFLECKPPNWKPPGEKAKGDAAQHYRRQCDVHDMLRRLGFVVGFVTSQDEACDALRAAGFKC